MQEGGNGSKQGIAQPHVEPARFLGYLVQDDNGALFIDCENDVSPEDGRTRTPINEFIAKDRNGAVGKAIQLLIDRMFEDRDAKGS